ncbi:MAG: SDR family oxidoreductase, partial [Planctomycetes bacterium]|nr:SDR family oxidoreductase [Planctomycetota bacterium]
TGQGSGGGEHCAYDVSKAGQIMFARCMAGEFAKDKIRVNSIALAWTDTDLTKEALDEIGRENIDFPMGRMGTADDVAGSTCYLLSDVAGFVTGSCHTVDGGFCMLG